MKKETQVKINKENLISSKAYMSYFQIISLILFTFSISYLIYNEIKVVDAAATPAYCCEKAKSGAVCTEVASTSECAGRSSPTDCRSTDYCSIGCCINPNSGKCDQNTPKPSCSAENFRNGADCSSVSECKKGCCMMGESAIWTTEKNCEIEYQFRGFQPPINFSKTIKSEPVCIFGVEKEKKGACVLQSENARTCKYITLGECNTRTKVRTTTNPNFFVGVLCSNPSLNTTCKARDHKDCMEGKEDVYWFDSCGNPEEVYDKCDLLKKSKYCKKNIANNEARCESVSCVVDGVTRRNGESWCKYDGTIGTGKDPVGSRHIKHVCFMGEEKIEPCSDYRNEICVQKDTSASDGTTFSQSACKVNNWRTCYSFNQLETAELEKKCKEETDCFVMDVNIANHFNFKVCVPQYPPGFSFETPTAAQIQTGEKTKTESNCAIATQTCTETWKWCLLTGWKCIDNCGCHEPVFTTKMNELCAALGDCGAWTNYNGDFTDGGYSLKAEKAWPPKLSAAEISKIKGYARPNPTQKPADPGDITLETQDPQSLETISGYDGILSGASGALGSALLAKILSTNANASSASLQTFPSSVNYAQYASGSFASVARGIGQGDASVPDAMLWAAVGFGIGFAIGYLMQLSTMWSIVIGAVIALIIFLFMYCKIQKFNVTFTCNKWERPTGGDCNAANKVDVPSTKYRCESLGQTCKLINEGTREQICIDKCKGNQSTQSIPEIKPWSGINGSLPTAGYIYRTIEDGYEIVKPNGGCIDPYTKVDFGIKLTDENDPDADCKFAQCKITKDASKPYEEIDLFFGDRSAFLPYHKADIFFPSPEALRHQYNLSDAKIKELSTQEFYVKCKSATGQFNPQPYKIKTCVALGPDLNAPVIRATIPEKGSHVKYGQESVDLQLFVNEPSNCKYSNVSRGYDEMENQFSCDTDLLNYTEYGWKCNTNLTNLNQTIYIKCRDISENNNTMSEAYEYNLLVTNNPLTISKIVPFSGQNIVSGVEPVEVNLQLETTGGAEDGKSICSYKGSGFEGQFFETDSNTHYQSWKYGMEGDYSLDFTCKDIAGNVAYNSTYFKIWVDDLGPVITRIYNSGGLKITTNEKAQCKYTFNRSITFDNATSMMDDELEHNSEWRAALYYIQCKDQYNTKGGIMQIKGYNKF